MGYNLGHKQGLQPGSKKGAPFFPGLEILMPCPISKISTQIPSSISRKDGGRASTGSNALLQAATEQRQSSGGGSKAMFANRKQTTTAVSTATAITITTTATSTRYDL